ncbi:MAG: shikimate dehydrogenase [Prevotellaceae bacterium]|nr:shikimate dehydrogenase [Prevotellaceae bacterium]
MKKYALIGNPLAQAMSKEFFDEYFAKKNINAQYELLELEEINHFPRIAESGIFSGFNITIPYKEKIIPFLDFLDKTAEKIGAVNAVKTKNGKLIGYNTDAYGFEKAILPLLKSEHRNALILGAGGAAKAVKFTLKKLGINSKFVSRKKSENNLCYEDLNAQILENNTVIINTTPVGAVPNVENCPNIPYQFLTQNHLLFDLICKPQKTLFLQKGEKMGANIENGLKMFYGQAIKSYKIWQT